MNGKAMLGGLLLAASLSVQAGEIVDTYTSGDTLTATMLDNIKNAVNDNNTASRFYGDGSAGDLTVSSGSTIDWYNAPIDNLNFRNVVVESGATLIVPAGTVIRCTGSFVNNGTIRVSYVGKGGFRSYTGSSAGGSQGFTGIWASAGDTNGSSQPGMLGTADVLYGGGGGIAIHRMVAASAFMNFRWGGGAGSGARYGGMLAGGLLKVLCRGEVRNEASAAIQATGSGSISFRGSGGGGGGIVVLASQDSVTNAGSIDVSGGQGGFGDTSLVRGTGPGGGGGGGIVVLVAPSVTNTGTIDISGGPAGSGGSSAANGSVTRFAGGGGGGSGGAGGSGASLDAAGVLADATAGEDGYVLVIQADPSTMM